MSMPKCPFKEYERERMSLKLPFFSDKPVRTLKIVLSALKGNKTKKAILMEIGYDQNTATRPTQCAGAFAVLGLNNILNYNRSARAYHLGKNLERYLIYVILFMRNSPYKDKYPDIYQTLTYKIPENLITLFNDLNL